MSAITVPFFHPAMLQSHYLSDLSTAVRNELLSEAEQALLTPLDSLPATLRADQPTLAAGQRLDPQLACAVVISHTDSAWPAVYLWTALDGIQPFNDRTALHQCLRSLQGDDSAEFELESINASVFETLAVTYLLGRGEHLEEIAQWFEQLPNLEQQLQTLLAPTVTRMFPEQPGGAGSLWLQVTQGPGGPVLRTLTLLQWHLQCFAGQALAAGEQLRWLCPDGQVMSEHQRGELQQVIDSSAQTLPDAFVRNLSIAWAERRESIAQLYGAAFYQALLQARSNGNVQEDHWPWLRAALSQGRAEGFALVDTLRPGQPLHLAGALLIADPAHTAVYAYDGFAELQHHASRTSLALSLASQPQPSPLLAVEDHAAWHPLDVPALLTTPLGDTPLLACVDAISHCQARDVRTCLALSAGNPGRAIVQVDEALDVRRNLDLRLAVLDRTRRWQSVQLLNQTVMILTEGPLVPTADWLKQHHDLSNRFKALRSGTQDAEAAAQSLLAPGLAVIEPLWTSQTVVFALNDPDSLKPRIVSLGDLLFERASRTGAAHAPLPAAQDIDGDGEHLYALHPALVEGLLQHAQPRLQERLTQTVDSDTGWRLQGLWEAPLQVMPQLRETLLRLELTMQRQYGQLPVALLNQLQQVLDYPLHSQRQGLPQPAEAHGLAVTVKGRAPVTLTNTFVVHAGGNVPGPLLFWSCLDGLQAFDSLSQLRTWLTATLQDTSANLEWQRLLPAGEQTLPARKVSDTGAPTLTLSTWQMTQPLTVQLQRDERNRQQRAVRQTYQTAMALGFDGKLIRRYMHITALEDALSLHLQGLSNALEFCHLRAVLPKWLVQAPLNDFAAYTALVHLCAYQQNLGQDYLFDIPKLMNFSKTQLTQRLSKDLGNTAPDPDQVLVTLRQYHAALVLPGQLPSSIPASTQVRRETLTAAALDQLSWFPGTPATLEMADLQALPKGLTPAYVRTLIDELNVAQQYRDVLTTKLLIKDPDYPERLRRYAQRVVPELLVSALQQKLKGTLSQTARDFIEHVLTTPDGLARPPLNGVEVVIRPLQLQGASYLDPDLVIGMHLIGPKDSSHGPQVLYTVYDAQPFREFANKQALLEALRTETTLQTRVLDHLDARLRARYAHGGFAHPHLPESVGDDPFTIELRPDGTQVFDAAPVAGNALSYLFDDNVAVLIAYAQASTVSRDEAHWKRWHYLMTLGLEQGTVLLPGSLSSMVNTWESKSWFQSAFTAAAQRRWGEALARFVAALALLSGAREGAEQMIGASRRGLRYSPGRSARPRYNQDTARQERLRPFQVQTLALNTMVLDAQSHLHIFAGRHYAVMEGLVYEVRQSEGHWHVFKGLRKGPAVEWQASGTWGLKAVKPVANAGFSITRIQDLRGTRKEIDSVFITHTRSMGELFAIDPIKAQQIGAGYFQAHTYLLTALKNLNARHPERPLPAKTEAQLVKTFGVAASTPKLLGKVRKTLKDLLSHLCDPTLEPLGSHRYVTGENRAGYENTYGFVFPHDPLKRIFLTERFFRVRTEILQQVDPTLTTVDPLLHLQASTLIHEISHLANDATDIAYLESTVPPTDTLLAGTPQERAFIDEVNGYQQRLSHSTPWVDLFTLQDAKTGTLRDLEEDDGRAMDRVLTLAKAPDLDKARDVFLSDDSVRADIILANADSIALLCTQLGHEHWQ